jgi:hypothetical protein
MIWAETVPAADSSALLGMPLPLLLAVIALISAVLTAVVGALVKKFRTPADDREDKVVVLDASDRLIQRFQQLLSDSDTKHAADIAALGVEVGQLREELNAVKQERVGLLWGIRQLIRIARKYGGDDAQREIDQLELAPSVTIQ